MMDWLKLIGLAIAAAIMILGGSIEPPDVPGGYYQED